jgi:cbb3-type cytochrome oxidase maturation protein
MDILYLLIPASVLLVLAILAVFAWALRAGQFDDLDREGERILDAPLDVAQVATGPSRKQ